MLIVQLNGGLGNQMFQYAVAHFQAMRLHVPFKLDTFTLDNTAPGDTPRSYELGNFVLKANLATEKEWSAYYLCRKKRSLFYRILNLLYRKLNRVTLFKETFAYQYDSRIEKIRDNTCLSGFFQSYQYFQSIKEELRSDFSLKEPLSGENEKLLSSIRETASVSIHFRRGDYLTNHYHGICSESYYKESILKIKESVENPVFYAFSDDKEWVEKTDLLKKINVHFIPDNPATTDIYLMSQCKHHICANSSFSWWGAWLGNFKDQMVIAPKQWLSDEKENQKVSDLLPTSWIRL